MSPVHDGDRLRPAREHFPLSRAGVCVDCEAVFEHPRLVCPACGSRQTRFLQPYLEGTRTTP